MSTNKKVPWLAVGLLIAVIIIFMDRVINNYGICTIVINDDKEINIRGGSTLLRVLFENKYFIPSACGGKGTCGYCKLQITEGGGTILPTEKLILTLREAKAYLPQETLSSAMTRS